MVELFNIGTDDQRRQLIKETFKADPAVKWSSDKRSLEIKLLKDDEGDTYIQGRIEVLGGGKAVAGTKDKEYFHIEDVRVSPRTRGNELGILLLDYLSIELEKRGIKHIFGLLRDSSAVALFVKAFGKNNIIFYSSDDEPVELLHGNIDGYLNFGTYIAFGVDITDLSQNNIPKKIGVKFKRKRKI